MHLKPALCSATLLLVLLLPLSANASSKLYVVYMGEKQHDDPSVVTASHHDVLTSVFGSKNEALKSIVYSYRHGFSGFAAMLTESQAEVLAKFPQVLSVKPNTYHKIQTTRSWDFLGLNYYQPPYRSSGILQKAKYGEDVIIGVIDSGIWPESRSFDDSGYGRVPARWKGTCETGPGFNATNCNRKIIGTRWYSKGIDPENLKGEYMSPRDLNGHGTHVASTIAGNHVGNVSYEGLGFGAARGGAPRARLAIYKVAWGLRVETGEAAIVKAIDDAIRDGVDVLSLSLSGGGESFASLHAVLGGIPVVFAGGNQGPAPQTVANVGPWVTTVAASTIDRSFPTVLSLGNKEKLVVRTPYMHIVCTLLNYRMFAFIYSSDATTNFTGKIVLVYTTPQPAFADALSLIRDSGAKGIVIAQHTTNLLDGLATCNDLKVPCVLVDFEVARRIVSYCTNTRKPVMKVSPAVTFVGDEVPSPRVAAFSSRGPSATFPALLKPDVAAPGASILAAKGDSYVFLSGTSMACPHVSAITALLKAVHPDWSPAMIKSAIITTSSVTDRFGAPIEAEATPRKLADPFDFGGGHIDPDRAVDPGLVYDIDAKEFSKFSNCTYVNTKEMSFDDCGKYMGQLYQLNLPSIALPELKGSITVQRSVTNVGPKEATYRAVVEAPTGVAVCVEPSVITFTQGGGRHATFKVTFTAKRRVQGGYTFGSLTWLDGNAHSVRIPIATRIVIQDMMAVADVS
ncbi:subtilisin-like protease SBT3.9 isoform X2 [Hordeum vulgare subsp. vulgare]|uniref:subtilisin-like protease SBT3.9 isoform X2 n=1 Tax=Hordeum vulgare subsp. vulgare TaxID=112509 RepID=UPI001D1A4A26|nr:subtilisin-like protease SBT3.9 isoform X2 [Hordeum vulgare subsp. vulgare]